MRCFPNSKPKRSSSDEIRNKKALEIYEHQLESLDDGHNYNSTVCYMVDQVTQARYIKKTHSYELRNLIKEGHALCHWCGLENPDGLGASLSTQFGIYTVMDISGKNLFDISCNVPDPSCDWDRLYDAHNTLIGFSSFAEGVDTVIDPSNWIAGACDCEPRAYLKLVHLETSGCAIYSNNNGCYKCECHAPTSTLGCTPENYLRMLGFRGPQKLKKT